MALTDVLKQWLDSAMSFTQMSRERAESIVNDLIQEGQLRTEEAQRNVQELMDRSRANTERFNDAVRTQVVKVLTDLGVMSDSGSATKKAATGYGAAPAKKTTTKKTTTKKKAAKKKAPAKRAPAKKRATTKKATGTKKAAAKKATG